MFGTRHGSFLPTRIHLPKNETLIELERLNGNSFTRYPQLNIASAHGGIGLVDRMKISQGTGPGFKSQRSV